MGPHLYAGLDVLVQTVLPLQNDQGAVLSGGQTARLFFIGQACFLNPGRFEWPSTLLVQPLPGER
ncbi:MAG: hypothetical protein R3330_09055, partial [Saprospiraceae bacterium]|nr:hypothetical protein [Saprospiraceae bacterium]